MPGIQEIKGFSGDYRWLSNFVNVRITFDGMSYPSVEHAFVAAKTLDKKRRILIGMAASSAEAKRMGKNVALREDWESVKESLMLEFLIQKFSTPKFSELLLATGDAYIEETNHWNDTYWGVCRGEGENRLGKMIMMIRDDLRSLLT